MRHGIGAVTMTHGTGTHGVILLGVIEVGMTRIMSEDGMTLGTMAAIGVITTLGIIPDIGDGTTGTDTTITHITADGTEVGILISTDTDIFTTNRELLPTTTNRLEA